MGMGKRNLILTAAAVVVLCYGFTAGVLPHYAAAVESLFVSQPQVYGSEASATTIPRALAAVRDWTTVAAIPVAFLKVVIEIIKILIMVFSSVRRRRFR